LYTEVRKQKHKQNEELQKKGRREQAQQQRQQSQPQTPLPEINPSDFSNEELVYLRYLLKYCNTILFEEEDPENPNETHEIKVAEFMIQEVENDDLIPENKLFRKIFSDVKDNYENDGFDPWKHFIYHSDAEVSKLATDLLSEKFIESKRWTKAGAFTEKEEEILDFLIPKIIYEYKLRKIKLMMEEIEKAIDVAAKENDFDRVIEEQSKYMNLKRVEKFLSEKLGSRAIN
jgi:DNA primase